jgi:Mg2+-importing ATPase
MLPSQILLNNLIYDTTQIAIATDRVDPDQLARPAHWDLREIRRFMLTFGPLSSLFDFVIFAILLQVLRAGQAEFQTGWFIESLATQILVVFVIRTHASPFWRSRPSPAMIVAALTGMAAAILLPYTPMAAPLGFVPLPIIYLPIVATLVVVYLALVEVTKRALFAPDDLLRPAPQPTAPAVRRERRRAARFTTRVRPQTNPHA